LIDLIERFGDASARIGMIESAGRDNLLNSRRRGGYVGVAKRFEDEVFTYLPGTLPRIAMQ
jgi:hypothetical protein